MRPSAVVVIAATCGLAAVGAQACRAREASPPPPEYRTTATVKDIMDSIVDPEADVLWNSVATIVSATGIEEKAPKTDEDWKTLRRSAIQLIEATNLLRIPGRKVAQPGEKSENPHIELEPAAIERLIKDDPAQWAQLINALHDAAVPALKVIESKNVEGLYDVGDKLEAACENCHRHYWYPPGSAPIWNIDQGLRNGSVRP